MTSENSHSIGGPLHTPLLIRNYCLMFATALDRETESFKFMIQCSTLSLIILITSHTEALQSSSISQETQPQLLSLIFLEHPLCCCSLIKHSFADASFGCCSSRNTRSLAIPSFPSLQPYWFIINYFSLSELFSSLVIFFDDLINLYNQIPPHLFKLPSFKSTTDISL